MTARPRIFLVSPANCRGRRAAQLLAPRARLPLAEQLRSPAGAPIGDLFAFISGLYFRGKLTYARRFAAPPASAAPSSGVQVITPNDGLWEPDACVTHFGIRAFARGDVDASLAAYRRPLERSARRLADISDGCDVVLLGSIATTKYTEVLLDVFGARLKFPIEFVGRGDMSRGGLLLRAAASGVELEYAAVAGAVRRGPRPPRLPPKNYRASSSA